MMKSLKLEHSINTYTATARALAFNKKNDLLLKEMEKARNAGIKLDEVHLMDIVKTLASVGNYEPIPHVI